MSENPELLRSCALQLVVDARTLDPAEVSGRVFMARGIILAALVLSDYQYPAFRETLPTLINNSDEWLERVFPDAESTLRTKRSILSSIQPATRSQALPETCVDLIAGLKNGHFFFSDMPDQTYPVVTESVA